MHARTTRKRTLHARTTRSYSTWVTRTRGLAVSGTLHLGGTVGEESDDNNADKNDLTSDWIDKGTHAHYRGSSGSSSTSFSSVGAVTEIFPLEKAKRMVLNYF